MVLRLLAAQQEAGKVTVRIGQETAAEQMAGTSMVSTAYGTSDTVFGVWVCWDPLGWTIRELSPVLPRLPFISAKSWVRDDARTCAACVEAAAV